MDTVHGGAETARYAGVDRRRPRARLRPSVRLAELGAFTAVVLVVGLLLPVAVRRLPTPDATLRALGALRITWAMLFTCAGVIRLVRWRLTGEARNGHLGVALLVFGLISAPSSMLAPMMFRREPALLLAPVPRLVSVLLCISVVMRGLHAPEVDSRLRPLRTTAILLAAAWTTLMVVVALDRSFDGTAGSWAIVEAALAAGWAACAVVAFRRAGGSGPSSTWIGMNLATMAVAESLRAVAFVRPDPLVFFATGVQLVVAAVSVANAGADLSEVFTVESERLLSLAGALHRTEGLLDDEQRRREERLHDARSVIAALKASSVALDRYSEKLDANDKHRLRRSMVSELSRLETVLDARAQQPKEAFRLDQALAPMLLAETRRGVAIDSQVGALVAYGRPLEFVTVVQNLIVNASRYAPGTAITLHAHAFESTVTVEVEDRGPGIPDDLRERVFERGYRAPARCEAAGSGLGLYLARGLMREQGGDIVVEPRPGGGARFVLTLPRAAAGSLLDPVHPGAEAVRAMSEVS